MIRGVWGGALAGALVVVACGGDTVDATLPIPSDAGLADASMVSDATVDAADATPMLDAGDASDADASSAPLTLSGSVTGLVGSGLVLQVGSERLAIAENGAFAFHTKWHQGDRYQVLVSTKPSDPTQTCTVLNPSGTIGPNGVDNIEVICAISSYSVGGTITGLVSGTVILANGAYDLVQRSSNGAFELPERVPSGAPYDVSVFQQPTLPWQTCTITGGTPSGTVVDHSITDLVVDCELDTFAISGRVVGLAPGVSISLQNDGETISVTGESTFTFPTKIASGEPYAVEVVADGSSIATCSATGNDGTVGGSDIDGVVVDCTANTFTVGGSVEGLAGGSLTLHLDDGDDRVVTSNGSFAFPTPQVAGARYHASISANPTGPAQTCVFATGTDTGTVGTQNVSSIAVSCSVDTYTVGGWVTGLAGTESIVLENELGDDLPVGANGTFTFPTSLASGKPYAVTVKTQPADMPKSCTISNATGTVGASNVTDVVVSCVQSGVAYYDLRTAVATLGADGYTKLPVLALGRLADGTDSTEAVVVTLSSPASGTVTPSSFNLTPGGSTITFVPCNGTTSPNCLGAVTLSMALASAPATAVATTTVQLVAPTGVGTDAPCLGRGNVLYFDGDPGDYIHKGQATLTDGPFTLSPSQAGVSPSTISVSYGNGDEWWYLDFSSRELNQSLAPNVYTGAQRYPFEAGGHPGLSIYGDGRGCNTDTGSFQVEDLTFNGTTVTSFTATFLQYCDNATGALHGCVHVEQ